jgi:2-polyprenyl-3-methyl-5-hydroxy-6-metoxy-1,4-benzoquinol methylase
MTTCLACEQYTFQEKVYDHHHLNKSDGTAPALDMIKSLVPENFIFKGLVDVCSDCGHGVLQSTPTDNEISTFYNSSFWGRNDLLKRVESATKGCFSNVHLARARHQKEFISQYIELQTLSNCLEIGPGDALLSQTLKKDTNPDAIFYVCEPGTHWEYYYKSIGLEKIADFFPFSSLNEPYELIVASHWLEHIPNVKEILSLLKTKLSKGGKLFIEVPNTSHDYWELNIKDTPHIHFFTIDSLTKLSASVGFSILEIAEFGISLQEHVSGKKPTYDELCKRSGGYSITVILENI